MATTSAVDGVRAASRRFYSALTRMANGDAAPMSEVWSHAPGVSTMHPIGGREVGWKQVAEPWQQVAQLSSGGEVALDQQVIEVLGDAAYEIGREVGYLVVAGDRVPVDLRVTNIYRLEGRQWKIVHHHTDLAPEMVAVIERVQAAR